MVAKNKKIKLKSLFSKNDKFRRGTCTQHNIRKNIEKYLYSDVDTNEL